MIMVIFKTPRVEPNSLKLNLNLASTRERTVNKNLERMNQLANNTIYFFFAITNIKY